MKIKRLLLAFIALNALTLSAQDVIVKKDGTPILAKVVKVNTKDVEYKKHSNQKGPTYSIPISDILSLTYANGDKEDFGGAVSEPSSVTNDNANGSQVLVQLPADTRNAEIISRYNTIYQPTKKITRSNAKATRCFIFVGVKEGSLMSNDELEMTFEAKSVDDREIQGIARRYLIKLTNKTDKTIYVDKGSSFRISSDGWAYRYYDPSVQTTVTRGGSTGINANLGALAGAMGFGGVVGQIAGGISIGGSSQYSTSTSYNPKRILAIPPHSFCYLTEDIFMKTQEETLTTTKKYITVEKSERFLFMPLSEAQIGIPKEALHKGEVRVFSENDLPWSRQYVIAYSTSKTFDTYSCLKCDMYIKEVIGSQVPKNWLSSKSERMEYGEDKVYISYPKYISSLNSNCIVGFTMFDGADESGTGTVIGED